MATYGMKRQPMERKKIFANHISDKGLISKIYKELTQLKSKVSRGEIFSTKSFQKLSPMHPFLESYYRKVCSIEKKQENRKREDGLGDGN